MKIEKWLKNSCGHSSFYRITTAEGGLDIDSDVNDLCEVCKKEDAAFKTQVAEIFSKMFEG